MKILISLLAFVSVSAFAQNIKVEFTKICAFKDDAVFDKVNFVLAADSTEVAGTTYSKTLSVTPGFCKKAETLAKFNMIVSANTISFSNPLRLQIAEEGLLIYKLDYNKVYVATKEQLDRIDCSDKEIQCIDIEDLKKTDRLVTLESKSELLQFSLSLKK